MIGTMKNEHNTALPFPKLMINENVVALFTNEKEGVVVCEISEDAVSVGESLGRGTFDVNRFSDYHGTISLSNTK